MIFMKGWVALFLESMASERGAARNTLQAYRRDLEAYAEALVALSTDFASVDEVALRQALHTFYDEGLALRSIARRHSAIRQFHGFLFAEGLRDHDPSSGVQMPRIKRALPKVLSQGDVEKLIGAVQALGDGDQPKKSLKIARLFAMLELLYATGLRVSELVMLRLSSFEDGMTFLRVRGKGGRERIVPLHEQAQMAVKHYMQLRQLPSEAASKDGFLFPAGNGRKPLARQVFAREMKALAAQAGLDPETVSPHVLRHAFASHLLSHGANLLVIQQLLGHADIATTQIYTHVSNPRLHAMVRDLHPLSEKN